jgi:hypothetical protein
MAAAFPRYLDHDPMVPVWCVTPDGGPTIHRYWDTSPFSPSGRYLALTRFPTQERLPEPGDVAEVIVVDLQEGGEQVVAASRGWDTQLGAQAQWGADDTQLFFNDMDVAEWRPFGVLLDPFSGACRELEGTVYEVSADGRYAVAPCPLRNRRTQGGYGVVVPPEVIPENRGAAEDDGVYMTNVATGERRLLVSLREVFEQAIPAFDRDEYADGDFYAAHVKFNRDASRLMLVLRWIPRSYSSFRDMKQRMKKNVVTMRAVGSDVRIAIPSSEWAVKGGSHPIWCPDGEHILMLLRIDGEQMRFVSARWDGAEYGALHEELIGSGHPSMHPDGRHILTDCNAGDPSFCHEDRTCPIRLCDIATGEDLHLLRINHDPAFRGPKSELRVDPHPAWDRSFTRIAFNACPDGIRRVYVADLSELVEERS